MWNWNAIKLNYDIIQVGWFSNVKEQRLLNWGEEYFVSLITRFSPMIPPQKKQWAETLRGTGRQRGETQRPRQHKYTPQTGNRDVKPVPPEQLTPWSAFDPHLSSKGRISVRLRSGSKGKEAFRDGGYNPPGNHMIISSSGGGHCARGGMIEGKWCHTQLRDNTDIKCEESD